MDLAEVCANFTCGRGMSGLIEHIELEKCRFMSRDRFL